MPCQPSRPFQLSGPNGPGNPQTNAFKAVLAKSLAFSRTYNNRNLHHMWYPYWSLTLVDLVADCPNLVVAPQYPLYFFRRGYRSVDAGDHTAIADPRAEPLIMSVEPEDDSDSSMDFDHDLSFSTTPGRRVSAVYATPYPQAIQRYGGWRITEMSVPLLVEEKRFTDRSLDGDDLMKGIMHYITEAMDQLQRQAAHLFLADSEAESVMVIGACGPYWSNMTIRRDDVHELMDSLAKKLPKNLIPRNAFSPDWSVPLRLDIPQSNARLRTVYNNLRMLGPVE
ncbi:hypothetical protein BU15DRAFT_84397 [Melanogaster broomeanus]|nr:hypothetical protein BU15DRAFT_84397 [Melanogaster broomeanus]